MLKRKPIPPDINRLDYNNGGLHDYDPYIILDKDIIINKIWWQSLTPFIRQLIKNRLNNFHVKDVSIPHKIDNTFQELQILDQCYLDGFDYHIWFNSELKNGPQDVQMIYISLEIKDILLELHDNYHDYSVRFSLPEKLNDFLGQITNKMEAGKEYFMRLSSTSGKNDRAIMPMCNVDDILNNLIKNKIFVKREYMRKNKDTYLILIPWNDKMDERYEFRIFVKDDKLVGASQQWWSTLFNYTQEELEVIEYALNHITFLKDIPYKDYIGDVYIDIEEKVCKLVEINPFGAHCGAGSALFNWITDYDILYNKKKGPELRYLSVINY